ncbi:MAG: 3',5'-cyclic adenosine monophosphate phosphodiesterase CpdA [Owenweeksia sp. TMED14]|nr:MAG: 3',5'-cyclic adenosine monophosphate phosphodiesterase CpdA [Owenweeksia sp. TMED14]
MKVFLLIPLIFFFILDLYAFQLFKVLQLGKLFEKSYWAFHIIGYIIILYSIAIYDPQGASNKMTVIVQIVTGWGILFYVPKLIPIFLGTIEDLYRGGSWVVGEGLPDRRKFISIISWGVAAIPFLGIIHGIFLGRSNYQILNNKVKIKGLPSEFDGFRILQISDIHSGSFLNFDEVEEGVNMVLEQKVDAIVFTGDLVNNIYSEMTPWIDLFKKIDAPYGVFSILGNHDYGDYVKWDSSEAKNKNMTNLFETHKKLGWKLLKNENTQIEKNGSQLDIVGVENWGNPPFPKYGDLDLALDGLDRHTPKILLSHDPSHFDAEVINNKANIALTLSGHTHGMQFGIEIPGWIKWSPVKFKYPKWAGHYTHHETKKSLYVNRGFGYLAFPGRVGIWPEITIHELNKL